MSSTSELPKLGSRRLIELLDLQSHPEGGFFKETFRDSQVFVPKSLLPPFYKLGRPVSTSIYFLVPSGSISHLHRIPSAETWHFYMGDPLTVFEIQDDGKMKQTVLGTDVESGQVLQYTVPPHVWFGSYPTKDIEGVSSDGSAVIKTPSRDPELYYSLVGCTCAPAFQFEDFEMGVRAELLSNYPTCKAFIEYLTTE